MKILYITSLSLMLLPTYSICSENDKQTQTKSSQNTVSVSYYNNDWLNPMFNMFGRYSNVARGLFGAVIVPTFRTPSFNTNSYLPKKQNPAPQQQNLVPGNGTPLVEIDKIHPENNGTEMKDLSSLKQSSSQQKLSEQDTANSNEKLESKTHDADAQPKVLSRSGSRQNSDSKLVPQQEVPQE